MFWLYLRVMLGSIQSTSSIFSEYHAKIAFLITRFVIKFGQRTLQIILPGKFPVDDFDLKS